MHVLRSHSQETRICLALETRGVQGDHHLQTLLDSRPTTEGKSLTAHADLRDADESSILVSRKRTQLCGECQAGWQGWHPCRLRLRSRKHSFVGYSS
jgi:hypothetical protein